jgi:UDP-N-acetylmuramate dehydrogenase
LSESNLEIKPNVPLAQYTSWNIGGPAEFFIQPKNLDELKESVQWAADKRVKLTVLSGGSNCLISDKGISGLVINLNKFTGTIVEDRKTHLHISALAGTPKSELLKIFLKYKLAPALFLAGIPGDVGGGVVMNAGIAELSKPREFVEIVDWIRVLRGQNIQMYTRDDLKWSYRHCEGWKPGIIVEVGIAWPMEPDDQILTKVREANTNRLKRQPLDKPSCGSVFINPEGGKSGQLIESSGLKGTRFGDAQVSEKHANFIVNLGSATAADTKRLIEHVQKTVKEKTGFNLKTEVVFLGE